MLKKAISESCSGKLLKTYLLPFFFFGTLLLETQNTEVAK